MQQNLMQTVPGEPTPIIAQNNNSATDAPAAQNNFKNFQAYQPPPAPQMQQMPQGQPQGAYNLLQSPPQSIEQQAMGGGVNNKQQVNNFMTALNNVGAGSNNAFMHAPSQMQQNPGNIVNPNVMNQPNQATTVSQAGNVSSGQPITTTVPYQQQTPPSFSGSSSSGTSSSGLYDPTSPTTPTTSVPSQQFQGNQFQGNQQSTPTPTPTPTTSVPSQQFHPLVSDENLKTNIEPATRDLKSFMNSIDAYNYEYKNKQHGVGRFTSPMAQDLESTELGKQAVIDTAEGKKVDYARLGGVTLASVAVLNQEKADKSIMERENKKLQNQINQLRKQMKVK